MPWFTVGLVPVDHPKAVDVRRTVNVLASIRPLDSYALDLDGRVHTRIHVGPFLGNIAQNSPVLAFPIGTAIPRRPDGLPERASRSTIVAGLLPPLSLFLECQPLTLQHMPLILQHLPFVLQILSLLFEPRPFQLRETDCGLESIPLSFHL